MDISCFGGSSDWGVDFNASKTKHIRFSSDSRSKQSSNRLFLGGKILEMRKEYKYLGLLFTSDLKFDRHVHELVLPKVRRIAGYLSHLLNKFQTERCTFLRILWLSKLHPIIEYGSAVWTSFVTQNTIDTIDKFQQHYFRKAMGLPSNTSGVGLLTR